MLSPDYDQAQKPIDDIMNSELACHLSPESPDQKPDTEPKDEPENSADWAQSENDEAQETKAGFDAAEFHAVRGAEDAPHVKLSGPVPDSPQHFLNGTRPSWSATCTRRLYNLNKVSARQECPNR